MVSPGKVQVNDSQFAATTSALECRTERTSYSQRTCMTFSVFTFKVAFNIFFIFSIAGGGGGGRSGWGCLINFVPLPLHLTNDH